MKYTGKALESLWSVCKEIEEVKQIDGKNSRIELPCYISKTTREENEARKKALDHLFSRGAITKPKKVKTPRDDGYYFYWAFLENDYQVVFNDIESQTQKSATINNSDTNSELGCGKLQIHLGKGTICYGNNNPIEISPEDHIIKFLVILINNTDIVQYTEIAKELGMNWWEGITNKEVAREVQYKKRDLVAFLRDQVGISAESIKRMIQFKRNVGYKIYCVD